MAIQQTQSTQPSDWQKIHTSPSPIPNDYNHMIETWENRVTRARYFIPYYSRTGRSWSHYTRNGQRLAFTSYATAANHIKTHSQPVREAIARQTDAEYFEQLSRINQQLRKAN